MLGVEFQGCTVKTVEDLARGGELHPVQTTYPEETGMPCGFSTPGFLMSSKALLDTHPKLTNEQIRH